MPYKKVIVKTKKEYIKLKRNLIAQEIKNLQELLNKEFKDPTEFDNALHNALDPYYESNGIELEKVYKPMKKNIFIDKQTNNTSENIRGIAWKIEEGTGVREIFDIVEVSRESGVKFIKEYFRNACRNQKCEITIECAGE